MNIIFIYNMCSIGDKLYIHIQADIQGGIPERKEIEYTPALFGMKSPKSDKRTNTIKQNNMTIHIYSGTQAKSEKKGDKEKDKKEKEGISFNPLVPLNLAYLPEKERRTYFTNTFLFQNFIRTQKNSRFMKNARTLNEAVKKDYINHNIRATLDALFPPQSVVYLDGKPYSVLDYQWTPGDWKMEVKSGTHAPTTKTTPNTSNASNTPKEPHVLLKSMPENVLTGENYVEPVSEQTYREKYQSISNAASFSKCPFYYITNIQLDLYPGTTLPVELVKSLPCRHKWNSVRMAWKNVTTKRSRRPRKRTSTQSNSHPNPEPKKYKLENNK